MKIKGGKGWWKDWKQVKLHVGTTTRQVLTVRIEDKQQLTTNRNCHVIC